MTSRRTLVTAATAALGMVLVATALLVASQWTRRAVPLPPEHDLAVVLVSGPNRLVTVDLSEMRIVRDVPLRTMALDIAADASSGVVVTPQCGGVSTDADDVIGLYDPRRDSGVDYVELPAVNPGLVAVRDGTAFVEHGLLVESGLFVSTVDLAARAVECTATLADGPGGSLAAGDGAVYALAVEERGTGPSALWVCALDTSTLATRCATPPILGATCVASDPASGVVVFGKPVAGAPRVGDGGWFASVREGEPLRPVAIPGLSAADVGCVTNRWVFAGSWGGDEPTPGDSWVAWVDRRTMEAGGRIEAVGGVSGLAALGDRLVVVEHRPCRLVVVDPRTAREVASVALGYPQSLFADVVVLPGRPAGSGAR
ncbi:MAG TPA: hypothetical protein VF902_02130 [Coriobacteriia bacterium]